MSPKKDPVADVLDRLHRGSVENDRRTAEQEQWRLDRGELLVAARALDPPVTTRQLAEACGVSLGFITQLLRREERARGLDHGALSDNRAPNRDALPDVVVDAIRAGLAAGDNMVDIAAACDVSTRTVKRIRDTADSTG